ncbi:MAG: phosphoribosylformylglycinamidine synthase subunit PurL [Deltaproteobacteria bacterium]|nr:phosphoribosylformylglycinamidine synthase subunit PurL [Deltaproteobacteria bacterium]
MTAHSADVISRHGLKPDEYEKIVGLLGREPNLVELGVFSAMWSEHCSYKSSRVHLKRLPTTGPRVLQGPGENAGVVDIGNGMAAAFKMESHNHPSYIEPYQGAATGVGGIMRDVFTMGARPIANLNSLRFGEPSHPKTAHLVEGVVAGIGGYGNCMGVPTVGGEVYFDARYNGNCLVNAFTVGVLPANKIFRGTASGVGNPVIYVGAKTGRDGIHGATMSSAEFDDTTESKRPTVQVGDPFTEKLLLEACLELFARGEELLVGIQDMGAAGLTSSSIEMAARAGSGLDLDVGAVPRREKGMTPYEIMLSESQERMLIVARAGKEQEVVRIFQKWDLDAAVVGKVTETGRVRIFEGEKQVADLPVAPLTDDAPKYQRPMKRPASLDATQAFDPLSLPAPKDLNATLLTLLARPTIASKRWVYRQYDHMVRLGGVVRPGGDAAVVRVEGGTVGLALAVDCNGRYCELDPRQGAKLAVAECARNVSCVGGEPLGLTDCLNFGNPEKPEVMWSFSEAVDGISEACKALEVPVVSGNVSLYNETDGQGIFPTPTVGIVGLVPDCAKTTHSAFAHAGDRIAVLGATRGELGGSEYLLAVHGKTAGKPPSLDLVAEAKLQKLVRELVRQGQVNSAHDCAEGGLGVALAECCVMGEQRLGARVKLESAVRADALLFGEDASRVVISVNPAQASAVEAAAKKAGVPFAWIGEVGGARLVIEGHVDVPVTFAAEAWHGGFERAVFGK